jgi:TolB-like protein/tetratricopeptide (TPR) repeat protein
MTHSMIGRGLGQYRILEQIGEGGMGVVYRARDERLERDVAIKVLPQGMLADNAARRRFRREALALSKLNHPNIATIHDFANHEGIDFLVMEYIEGMGLREKLAGGALPERELLHLGVHLADALAVAHEHGIVHRDLKPGNLRVTPDGRLKILDFGLAQSVLCESDTTSTETPGDQQRLAGTLPYMAPEQLRGELADHRSDIYAAGVVLYEMAAGRHPFPDAHGARLISAILNQAPVPPSARNPQLAAAIDGAILKAMDKDPALRYQSAGELAVDLRRLAAPTGPVALVRRGVIARRRALGALVATVLLTAVLVRWWPGPPHPGGARGPKIESLAVLPFENLSRDPEQDYFADGMTEALITDLGQIGALRVISRTSVMRYKGAQKPLGDIARELNVEAVVEGSVLRADGRAQVTARLILARTDAQLWSQSYERELREVLGLQRELARAIVGEIRVKLTPQEQARLATARPVDPRAHEAYLRGSQLATGTYEQRRRAREYFEQAVRIDPEYAPAYAGLADSYWATPDMPPRLAMAKAKEHALKALAIDETLAHAHRALASIAFYADWDWAGAERAFQRALELTPGDAQTHRMYSVFLSAMGRFAEARAVMQAAQRLDPLSLITNVSAGWMSYYAREYDQAIEQSRKTLELYPNSDGAHACLGYSYLGKGMYERAIAESQRAVALSGGDAVRLVGLGHAYARAGRKAEAQEVLQKLRRAAQHGYSPPYFLATLHAALGENRQALAWLEKAYSERDQYLAWLKVDELVDPLRPDERFKDLLRRVGL